MRDERVKMGVLVCVRSGKRKEEEGS